MSRTKSNSEREDRIEMEIVVDCYNEHERRIGWSCYLEDKLQFPFQARCIKKRSVSPLNKDEEVTVLGMLDDDSCDGLGEIKVKIRWQSRTMGAPLEQFMGIDVDD